MEINKTTGKEVHETNGNKIFRVIFNKYHLSNELKYPLILLFSKGKSGYDRIFEGALKPDYNNLQVFEDLVVVWKTKSYKRFQNYKAIFTILPIDVIKRGNIIQDVK